MRILHVYKDYPPVRGGIEHHLQLLAEGQAALGHEVTVLVTSPGRRTTVDIEGGVHVIRAGRIATLRSTPLSAALVAEIGRSEADVTHLQSPYPLGEMAHLTRGRSRTTVVTHQSDIVRQRWLGLLYRPVQLGLLRCAQRIITSSPQYVAVSRVLARFAPKCTPIPLGIDPERWDAPDPGQVNRLRERWQKPLLLFVGRLRYYKGLEVLIDASERVEATVVVVGDGPMRDHYRRRASASRAAERIHFVGNVPAEELPAYYAAADLLVLPSTSRAEAFGLVQLEAMAAGTPVVCTELGTGTSYVNRDQETGRVVPPHDPAALADAVNDLLADPLRLAEMGRNARQRVHDHFTAKTMVEATLEVYHEALNVER